MNRSVGARLMGVGVGAMRQWRVSTKIVVLVAVLLAPLVMLQVQVLWQGQQAIEAARREQAGVVLLRELGRLAGQLHDWQDQQAAQPGIREAASASMGRSLAALDSRQAEWADFQLGAAWQGQRDALRELLAAAQAFEEDGLADRTAGLRQLLDAVADRSGLRCDPQRSSGLWVVLALERLPAVLDATTPSVLAQGVNAPAERRRWIAEVVRLRRAMDAAAHADNWTPPSWSAARGRFDAVAATTRQADPVSMAEVRESLLMVQDEVVQRLEGELGARLQRQRATLVMQALVSAIGVMLMVYLARCFYVSFSGSLRSMCRSVDSIAAGDLARPIDVRGRDELAETGAGLETMAERLSALVSDIRSTAVRVGQAGERVAEEGRALASRTDVQATSLRDSLTHVQQLTGAVTANAQAVSRLNVLTEDLR
jgi:hypothetical protein